MTFTDDDLKRLKDDLPLIGTFERWLTTRGKVEALISRLEAGERIIKDRVKDYDKDPLLEDWRRKCGL